MDKLLKIVQILGHVLDMLNIVHGALSGITDKLKPAPVAAAPAPAPVAAPVPAAE